MAGDRYLRNRPFLTIQLVKKPAKGVRTSVKGWGAVTGNWENFEIPNIVDRINDKQMSESSVIIDIMNSTMVKTIFKDNSDEDVIAYYMGKYREQIIEAINIWQRRQPKATPDAELESVLAKNVEQTYTLSAE